MEGGDGDTGAGAAGAAEGAGLMPEERLARTRAAYRDEPRRPITLVEGEPGVAWLCSGGHLYRIDGRGPARQVSVPMEFVQDVDE